MPSDQKRVPEMIVDVLRSGKEMELSEIAASVSKLTNGEIKFSNIANHMTRLFHKTEIGNFIIRKRPRDRYVYALAKGAQGLTPEQAYELVCGIGRNKTALKKALRAKPSLRRYLKEAEETSAKELKPVKRSEPPMKNAAGPDKMKRSAAAARAAASPADEKKNGSNGLNINLHVTVRFQPVNPVSVQLRG